MRVGGETGHKIVHEIVQGTWDIPDALERIKELCQKNPIHEERLKLCLKSAGATMQRFLGKGAHGRMFAVTRKRKTVAMKVVADVELARLEVDALQRAAEAGAPCVQVVTDVQEVACGGGFYLLQPVGDPVSRDYAKRHAADVLRTLKALHKVGIAHGDARVDNLVLTRGGLLWLDFMASPIMTEAARKRDLATLHASMQTNAGDLS